MRNGYKIFMEKPEGTRPLQVKGREGVEWIYVAYYRYQWWAFMNAVMNLRVPWKVRNFFSSCVTFRSSRTLLRRVVKIRGWLLPRLNFTFLCSFTFIFIFIRLFLASFFEMCCDSMTVSRMRKW
jgi:hypothetical protein